MGTIISLNFLNFQLSKPKVHGVARHDPPQDLRTLTKHPVFFHWQGSTVGQVYLSQGDPNWAQNVKMGIISLLQLQREAGKQTEVSRNCLTVSGCQVTAQELCKYDSWVDGLTEQWRIQDFAEGGPTYYLA